MLEAMRSCLRSALVLALLGSASIAVAQEPDSPPKEKEKRPRLVKPEGEGADNEQLGGEPTLTERDDKVRFEKGTGEAPEQPPDDDCDLDCLEKRLEEEEEKERSRKGTLEIAREEEGERQMVTDDAGDALSAEPSTTPLGPSEVDVPEERKLPTRLGPVRIRIGDTEDWIGIGLATQIEFQYSQQLPTAGFPKEGEGVLEFRRIRATLSSSFIEGRIRSRFQINLTPSAFELIDLWFAFTRLKFATFRLGQFKIPFDRYRAQSFAALSFVDWAPTTRMFGSERQIGVEMLASGGFLGLEYAIGIFTGENARAAHAVGITEVYGEVPQNPSALGTGEVVNEFHPELAGRFAKNFGEINTNTNTDVTGSRKLRHSLGGGIAGDIRPNATQDLALRLQAEWLGKIRHAHMNFIGYFAWYEPWQGGRIRFGPMGFMGEVGYRFSLLWGLALRYSITYLTPWLRSDARSYGADQILNAEDPAAALLQFGRNGDQVTNQELALAGTAYIIGDSLKAIAEFAWEAQLWNTGRRNGVRGNLQLQLLF